MTFSFQFSKLKGTASSLLAPCATKSLFKKATLALIALSLTTSPLLAHDHSSDSTAHKASANPLSAAAPAAAAVAEVAAAPAAAAAEVAAAAPAAAAEPAAVAAEAAAAAKKVSNTTEPKNPQNEPKANGNDNSTPNNGGNGSSGAVPKHTPTIPKLPGDSKNRNRPESTNPGLPPSNFHDHEVPESKDTVTLANFLEVVNGKWVSDNGATYIYFTPQFLMAFDDYKRVWSSSFIPTAKYGPRLYRIAGYDEDNLILTCYPVDEAETFDNYVVFRLVNNSDNSLVLNIVYPNKDITYGFERNLTKAEYKKLASILRSIVLRNNKELKNSEKKQKMPESDNSQQRPFNSFKARPSIII